MLQAVTTLLAVSIAHAIAPIEHSSAASGQTRPIAYVRSIVVSPARADFPRTSGEELPSVLVSVRRNPKGEKELRAQLVALRKAAPQAVQEAVAEALARTAGIAMVRQLTEPSGEGVPLAETAAMHDADASLSVTVDRCGMHVGFEREVWVRIVARMERRIGEAAGPFYGVGSARATRRLIGKGYSRTDDQLVVDASRQAAAQMAREMRTGELSPFSRNPRIAVIPALVPQEIRKRIGNNGESGYSAILLPTLLRQRDVLFQPDLPHTVEQVDSDDVTRAVKELDGGHRELWKQDGTPSLDALQRLSERLRADFLFISRIRDAAAEEVPVEVMDGKTPRGGVERKVEVTLAGSLYSARERSIIWSDVVEGGTIARTEYARGRPRIRTDEQAVMDAAHTAFAYLRYSFDQFHRRYYR